LFPSDEQFGQWVDASGLSQLGTHEIKRDDRAAAIEGWLAYGAALNEGRGLFPGDREFGEWVAENVLGQLAQGDIEPKDQQAAMWAAANQDDFDTARAAGNARTVRGIHAKWLELDAERKAAEDRERAGVARERAEAERAKVDLLQRNLDDLRRMLQTAQNLP